MKSTTLGTKVPIEGETFGSPKGTKEGRHRGPMLGQFLERKKQLWKFVISSNDAQRI